MDKTAEKYARSMALSLKQIAKHIEAHVKAVDRLAMIAAQSAEYNRTLNLSLATLSKDVRDCTKAFNKYR